MSGWKPHLLLLFENDHSLASQIIFLTRKSVTHFLPAEQLFPIKFAEAVVLFLFPSRT